MSPGRPARSAAAAVPLALAILLAGCRAEPPATATAVQTALLDDAARQRIGEALAAAHERPRDPARRARLGAVYHAHALWGPAVASYRQALARAPRRARWWYLLAHALAGTGDVEGAAAAAGRALELDPAYLPAYWNLGLWWLQAGHDDRAETAFAAAAERVPDHPAGPLGLARVALERGDAERATALLETVLERSPGLTYARQLLGNASLALGRPAEGAAALAGGAGAPPSFPDPWLDEVRRLRAGYRALIEEAQALLAAGRSQEAIEQLAAAQRDHPEDYVVAYTLGTAYFGSGRLAEAATAFEAAAAVQPGSHLPPLGLGAVRELEGDFETALALTDRAIALNPAYANAHRQRARILRRLERPAAALASIEEALRYDPRSLELAETRLRLLEELGRWPDLATAAERLTRDLPHWPGGFLYLALARGELGDAAGARAALRNALAAGAGQQAVTAIANRVGLQPPAAGP